MSKIESAIDRRCAQRAEDIFRRLVESAPAKTFTGPVHFVCDDKTALAGRPEGGRACACAEVRPDGGRRNEGYVYVTWRFLTKFTEQQQEGVLRHELAHVALLMRGDHEHTERRADEIAHALWGKKIKYDSKDVQTIGAGVSPRPAKLDAGQNPVASECLRENPRSAVTEMLRNTPDIDALMVEIQSLSYYAGQTFRPFSREDVENFVSYCIAGIEAAPDVPSITNISASWTRSVPFLSTSYRGREGDEPSVELRLSVNDSSHKSVKIEARRGPEGVVADHSAMIVYPPKRDLDEWRAASGWMEFEAGRGASRIPFVFQGAEPWAMPRPSRPEPIENPRIGTVLYRGSALPTVEELFEAVCEHTPGNLSGPQTPISHLDIALIMLDECATFVELCNAAMEAYPTDMPLGLLHVRLFAEERGRDGIAFLQLGSESRASGRERPDEVVISIDFARHPNLIDGEKLEGRLEAYVMLHGYEQRDLWIDTLVSCGWSLLNEPWCTGDLQHTYTAPSWVFERAMQVERWESERLATDPPEQNPTPIAKRHPFPTAEELFAEYQKQRAEWDAQYATFEPYNKLTLDDIVFFLELVNLMYEAAPAELPAAFVNVQVFARAPTFQDTLKNCDGIGLHAAGRKNRQPRQADRKSRVMFFFDNSFDENNGVRADALVGYGPNVKFLRSELESAGWEPEQRRVLQKRIRGRTIAKQDRAPRRYAIPMSIVQNLGLVQTDPSNYARSSDGGRFGWKRCRYCGRWLVQASPPYSHQWVDGQQDDGCNVGFEGRHAPGEPVVSYDTRDETAPHAFRPSDEADVCGRCGLGLMAAVHAPPQTNPAAFNVYEWANTYAKVNGIKTFDVSPTYESSGRLIWKLHWLIVAPGERRAGKGTAAMEALCTKADKHGATLVANLASTETRTGTTSRSRLVRFYKRFDFVENRGRKADHSISEEMIRRPHAS